MATRRLQRTARSAGSKSRPGTPGGLPRARDLRVAGESERPHLVAFLAAPRRIEVRPPHGDGLTQTHPPLATHPAARRTSPVTVTVTARH